MMRRRASWIAFGMLVTLTSCSALTSFDGLSSGTGGKPDDGGLAADGPGPSTSDGGPITPTATRAWRRLDVVGPSARHSARMAYDEARQRIVLVGGAGDEDATLADTWEWDGTTWLRVATSGVPGQRMAGIVYDADRKLSVLFGGPGASTTPLGWDGSRWTPGPAVNDAPAMVHAPGLVYDSARRVLVLFGGYRPSTSTDVDETWEWTPTTGFVRRTFPTSPKARLAHVMVYDSDRSRVVLFAGKSRGPLNDVWEYDGTSWSERPMATAPPERVAACAAYDSVRKTTVIFGGRPDEPERSLADTWEWNGTSWRQGPDGPPARRACAMAFDKARNAIVMFGGSPRRTNQGSASLGDTWIYE